MTDQEPTLSAQTLLYHINRFQAVGGVLPEGPLLGRWDIAEEMLENSDQRFPISLVATSVEFASQQLQDPVLGLTMMDDHEVPFPAIMELMNQNSGTLEEFIQLMSRYFCLFTEIGVYQVLHKKPHSKVVFSARNRSVISDHQVDGAMLNAARSIERYAGIKPDHVDVDHSSPAGCEAIYRQKFGCTVSFSESQAALHYPFAEMVCLRRDVTSGLISPVLEQKRDQLYGRDIIEKTAFLIRRLLIRGEPRRETIASALALSLRTFQRILSSENTSYKALLEATRQQMAREYLQESTFTVQEIALLLGYTETSQFYKAFRRWFDCGPGDFRRQMAADREG